MQSLLRIVLGGERIEVIVVGDDLEGAMDRALLAVDRGRRYQQCGTGADPYRRRRGQWGDTNEELGRALPLGRTATLKNPPAPL